MIRKKALKFFGKFFLRICQDKSSNEKMVKKKPKLLNF